MTMLRSIFDDAETAPQRGRLKALAAHIAAWWAAVRDYHAAAAAYEDLSRLSDAELARRDLDRATLARDVCEAAEAERDARR